jgi:ribosomal protein L11 methylase PrmA
VGLDWGCGSGCLAIAAATIPAVRRVVGLDIVEASIDVARSNAARNGVADKTVFMRSDSYAPCPNGKSICLNSIPSTDELGIPSLDKVNRQTPTVSVLMTANGHPRTTDP